MVEYVVTILKRMSRPLRAIEYIVSIGILWAAAVSAYVVVRGPIGHGNGPGEGRGTLPSLLEQFQVVPWVILLISIFAIIDIIFLFRQISPSQVLMRARMMFGIATGLFFTTSLTVISSGIANILWVNQFTMALICSVLYLNLRVHYHADR
jgi:hypothetical protein